MGGSWGPGNRRLATIDTATGTVSIVGPTAVDLDAISFTICVPVELQGFSVE